MSTISKPQEKLVDAFEVVKSFNKGTITVNGKQLPVGNVAAWKTTAARLIQSVPADQKEALKAEIVKTTALVEKFFGQGNPSTARSVVSSLASGASTVGSGAYRLGSGVVSYLPGAGKIAGAGLSLAAGAAAAVKVAATYVCAPEKTANFFGQETISQPGAVCAAINTAASYLPDVGATLSTAASYLPNVSGFEAGAVVAVGVTAVAGFKLLGARKKQAVKIAQPAATIVKTTDVKTADVKKVDATAATVKKETPANESKETPKVHRVTKIATAAASSISAAAATVSTAASATVDKLKKN